MLGEMSDKEWNIFFPFPQRRNVNGKYIQPVEQSERNRCSSTIALKSRLVAAINRAFVRRVPELPRRSNSRSCRTRKSFG